MESLLMMVMGYFYDIIPLLSFDSTSRCISSLLASRNFLTNLAKSVFVGWVSQRMMAILFVTQFIMNRKAPWCTILKFIPPLMASCRICKRAQFLLILCPNSNMQYICMGRKVLLMQSLMMWSIMRSKPCTLYGMQRAMERRNINIKVLIYLRSLWSLFLTKMGSPGWTTKESYYEY